MLGKLRSRARALWSPDALARDRNLLAAYRIQVSGAGILLLLGPLLLAALVGAFVLHQHAALILGLCLLVAYLLTSGAMWANALRHTLKVGALRGWTRKLVGRSEKPLGFWAWMIAIMAGVAIQFAAAGLLIGIAVGKLP
jgi:hypothetical protein